jgi:hypothetical protein
LLLYSSHLPLGVPNGLDFQLGTNSFLAPSSQQSESDGSLLLICSQLLPFLNFFFSRVFQLLKAVLIFVRAKESTFLLNGYGNVYRW